MGDNEDSSVDELAARAAAMELSSAGSPSPRSATRPRRPPDLQLQLPNPFEAMQEDESMPTASPGRNAGGLSHEEGEQERSVPQRVAAVPALPQPPRLLGRTRQDQLVFMQPESRMMSLQADMEAVLDEFNLTDVAFAHKQQRLVKYPADALAPPSFKVVIATKLTLCENKIFKNEAVPFCSWVTKLMK
ncbi:hypothetical protein PF010_g5715 [Phytophthora fragariae]|uniref:Uncharacterized protein n=1 Tax=Phytophthora fragariae TaxID=53985 RepID=A0A6G0LNF0_9STRA|nr:hypothetical protein PF010_g5715 [Phytophthora fragariae]